MGNLVRPGQNEEKKQGKGKDALEVYRWKAGRRSDGGQVISETLLKGLRDYGSRVKGGRSLKMRPTSETDKWE